MSNTNEKGTTLLPKKRRGDRSLDQALDDLPVESNDGSLEP